MRNYLTIESLYHRCFAGSYLRYKHTTCITCWHDVEMVFHVEMTWKRLFPNRFNMDYICCVCTALEPFQLNIVFHFNNLQPKRLETMWNIGLKWLFNELIFKISLRDFFVNSIIHLVPVFSFISKCTKNEDFY